jgi:hypothetical protein
MTNTKNKPSITKLDVDGLVKFTRALSNHIASPKNPEMWLCCLDNSLELSQSLSTNTDYDDDTISTLQDIVKLIETVIPLITDPTLKHLLIENEAKLREFFNKKAIALSNQPYGQENPSIQDILRKLANEITVERKNRELSSDWSKIANTVKNQYESMTGNYQFSDLDKWMEQSLKRYRERKEESEKRKLACEIKQTPELSYEADSEEYFRQKVLLPLASKLLKECKEL